MINVGVIGLGIAGQRHLAAYQESLSVEIVGVADKDIGKAKRLGKEYDAAAFADLDNLLEEDLDALSVCLPHAYLAEAAIAAADRGLHVLLEKPMATSLAEAEAVAQAFRATGTVLMIGYVHRFRDEVEKARELLQQKAIGECYLVIESSHLGGDDRAPRWIWEAETAGGGVLMYNGVHSLDRILSLTGAWPKRVRAVTQTLAHSVSVEDYVSAVLEFESGLIAQLIVHFPPSRAGNGWVTEFHGTQGVLSLRTGEGVKIEIDGTSRFIEAGPDRRFRREIDEFLRAVREQDPPSVDGGDGLEILAIAEAVYRSAENGGKWVELDESIDRL